MMARLTVTATALAALAPGPACTPSGAFDEPLTLGGRVVAPEVLNRGREVYTRYCAACHGADGRADTVTARALERPPRDLTLGEYTHHRGPGALPSDADLRATVRFGLPGTGMPAWPSLDDADLDAVVQYIKAFSPRWRAPPLSAPTGAQTMLPARGLAASVRAGQTWRGDATTTPPSRLALRAAGQPVAALGER